MSHAEKTALLFKALAHPVRVQIIEELARSGEACVCHLEHRLGQRQAYISQQLARLRDAGIVSDRRDGMNVYYALADPTVAQILHAVSANLQDSEAQSLHSSPNADPSCPCPRCQQNAAIEFAEYSPASEV